MKYHVLKKYMGTETAPPVVPPAVVDRYAQPAAMVATGYPGSKGGNGVWQQIVGQIPPHDLYVEVCAGSAQVLQRMRPPAAVIAVDCDDAVCQKLRAVIAARPDLAGVSTVVCDTAAHWLSENCRRLNQRTVVYCDPPYLADVRSEPGRAYYARELDLPAQHIALIGVLERLGRQGVRCLLSGYRCEVYDRLLKDWRRVDYTAATHGGPVIESLWCNFPEPAELHDPRVAGRNFRERERIRRRAKSWVKMVSEMPLAERAAVIAALDEWRAGSQAESRHASSQPDARRSVEITALYMGHSGMVAFYIGGYDIGYLQWDGKVPCVLNGTAPHPQFELIVATYLKDRSTPADATFQILENTPTI
jgi:DNA adenine methylase